MEHPRRRADERLNYAACVKLNKNMNEASKQACHKRMKEACHKLADRWEMRSGGREMQHHGDDFQQGLRVAYNDCCDELRAMAGDREPEVSNVERPSTLASVMGSAAHMARLENSYLMANNLANLLVAADGDDLIGTVENIIKQRDQAQGTLREIERWMNNEAVELDCAATYANDDRETKRHARLVGGIETLARLKDHIRKVQQNDKLSHG